MPTHLESYAPLPGAIRAEGEDPRRLLEDLGVEPDAPAGTGPLQQRDVALGLMQRAMETLGDGFPVRCAAKARLEQFGVLGYACLTAPDLRSALERGLRYRRLVFEDEDYSLDLSGPSSRLRRRSPDASRFEVGARGLVELGLAEHLTAIREVLGEDVRPTEVRFAHPAPKDPSEHVRFFGVAPRFAAARNELAFPAEWLSRPTRHGHPALAAYFEAQAREELARSPVSAGAIGQVRAVLAEGMADGVPALSKVAKRLAVSERTLARRLAAEGTTYQRVVDALRLDLALRYLERRDLAVAEIAFLLGFSEPSAFHRAFRRWTGRTPAQVREGVKPR